MAEPKKYSLQEVRAAKERTVMKTAVRPAARPPPPKRSHRKPLALFLAFAGVLFLGAAVCCRSAWNVAASEVDAFYAAGTTPEPALVALDSDRQMEKLGSLFKPPTRLEWLEVDATARGRRTGNARARQLTLANGGYLSYFRSVFPMEAGSETDVYKSEAPMLGSRYDLTLLEQMLVSTVAMGHYLLDSGSPLPGEELLFGAIRAGQMLARGTAGRYSARAFEMGETAATLARLQLLSHAFTGSLPASEAAMLASRLKTTLPLEPDYRRVLIAERDRSLAIADRARDRIGIWWPLLGLEGYEEPQRTVTKAFTEALEEVTRPPLDALAALQSAAAGFERPAVHPFARPAAAPLALYSRVLVHKSVAAGAVAAATVFEKLSHQTTLPDSVKGLGLPNDPVTGQPYLYQNLGDTYRFYGVGPDGKDDGGDETKDIVLLGPPKS